MANNVEEEGLETAKDVGVVVTEDVGVVLTEDVGRFVTEEERVGLVVTAEEGRGLSEIEDDTDVVEVDIDTQVRVTWTGIGGLWERWQDFSED